MLSDESPCYYNEVDLREDDDIIVLTSQSRILLKTLVEAYCLIPLAIIVTCMLLRVKLIFPSPTTCLCL